MGLYFIHFQYTLYTCKYETNLLSLTRTKHSLVQNCILFNNLTVESTLLSVISILHVCEWQFFLKIYACETFNNRNSSRLLCKFDFNNIETENIATLISICKLSMEILTVSVVSEILTFVGKLVAVKL